MNLFKRINHKLNRFLSLPAQQKRLVLEAFVWLGVLKVALWWFPFKKLTKNLKQGESPPGQRRLEDTEEKLAEKIGGAVVMAAHNTPWESACLVQSLTAQRMLKRRGIPGAFVLGVSKRDGGLETLAAHAWTLCGDRIITGKDGHDDYTVVSVFSW